jgi:hypothetical protein
LTMRLRFANGFEELVRKRFDDDELVLKADIAVFGDGVVGERAFLTRKEVSEVVSRLTGNEDWLEGGKTSRLSERTEVDSLTWTVDEVASVAGEDGTDEVEEARSKVGRNEVVLAAFCKVVEVVLYRKGCQQRVEDRSGRKEGDGRSGTDSRGRKKRKRERTSACDNRHLITDTISSPSVKSSPPPDVIDRCSHSFDRANSLEDSGGKTKGFDFFPQTLLCENQTYA